MAQIDAYDEQTDLDEGDQFIIQKTAAGLSKKILWSTINDLVSERSSGVYRNLLINGAMQVAQRGTSFAAVANEQYTLDRFLWTKVGTGVHTITQDSDVPISDVFRYSMKVDCTTADASLAAGDLYAIQYRVEGFDFAPYVGKTGSIGFWVKSPKSGAHCVSFVNSGADRSYIAEYTVDSADTWQFITLDPITFNYSGGTWDYENGIGLRIYFCFAAGTTYQTTADAWQTGLYMATSNQVNVCDSSSNDFFITGVQFNLGSVALPFEHKHISKVLDDCQRYYQFASRSLFNNDVTSGAVYNLMVPLQTRMRAIGAGATIVTTITAVLNFPSSNPTVYQDSYGHFEASLTANGTGAAGYFIFSWTADAEL